MDTITYDTDFDLDAIAWELIRVGNQPLIAKAGEDGNSFPLCLLHAEATQIELRRAPAMSRMPPLEFMKHLDELHRPRLFNLELLDIMEAHLDELARSRIKSVMIINELAGFGEPFRVVELQLKGAAILDRVEHNLKDLTFTGRHWVATLIDR